jgi:hypothetical protein
MPLLDPAKLEGYRQKRLAHLQLTVISTGYIWQDGEKGMPDVCITLSIICFSSPDAKDHVS